MTPGTAAGAPTATPRRLVEVAPGVHVATAVRYTTTSTVLVAADGSCVVVDPAVTPGEVSGLAAAVQSAGRRVHGGFATHPHWDHVLWADALGGSPRWATPACAAVAARERDALVRAAVDDGEHGERPALRTVGRLTPLAGGVLPWSREVVVVPYRAHAPGSAALVVADARTLVAGDVLSDLEVPLLDLDAADPIGDHLVALDALEGAAAVHGVRVVLPGHGHVTDAAGMRRRLAADRDYLEALAAGRAPDDARLADPWVRGEHDRQTAALRDR
ncbi:MBL fold metallo-hydrolase [Actinotalea sp. Marseille-Q4924]|uniref:MBL fold metallo-hydrolase n=1 Tax=Actinotalea sp. Marseille-Q4924 TaxID=2866571 RepID=UPI001CE4036A|nr:MBL fold metallo-hydrolase [Actinotalea sp. Marseille-Q4924]